MAIIGFLLLFAIGGYCLFAGVVCFIAELGLTGKADAIPFVILCLSAVILYVAFKYAPFTISFSGS